MQLRGLRLFAAILSAAVVVVGAISMSVTAIRAGVSWDEPVEALRMQKVLDGMTNETSGEMTVDQDFGYGLAFQWLAHLANIVRGNEALGTIALTAEAYAVRHLVVVVLGLTTVVAVGIATTFITRDVLVGLLASAALSSMPLWIGHGGFNAKDVPVAAGFTFVSTGLVAMSATSLNGQKQSSQVRLLFVGMIFLGSLMAVGVRPGMWVVLLVQILVTSLLVARQLMRDFNSEIRHKLLSSQIGWVLGSFTSALFCVVLIHPHLWQRLAEFPMASLQLSARFGQEAWTLTAGQLLYSQELPWWYLPAWLIAGLPILLAIFGLGGLIRTLSSRALRVPASPVAFQLLALPLVAIAMQSPMYDGQRHHLSFLPALAVYCGVGISWLITRVQNDNSFIASSRPIRVGVVAVIAATFVLPTTAALSLSPYSYVYTNYLVSLRDDPTRYWETDYSALSFREAITKVPSNGVLDAWGPSFSYLPYVHLRSKTAPGQELSQNEFWWLKLNRNADGVPVPPTCTLFDQVDREVWGKTFVMSRVFRCQIVSA